MTMQLVTRVPDELVDAVDHLIEEGVFSSRSEAVRVGLTVVIDRRRRAAVGRAIADGYRRVPQGADELGWSDAASVAMIDEEPW